MILGLKNPLNLILYLLNKYDFYHLIKKEPKLNINFGSFFINWVIP